MTSWKYNTQSIPTKDIIQSILRNIPTDKDDTSLFTHSTCHCTTCRAMNDAVASWKTWVPTNPVQEAIKCVVEKLECNVLIKEDNKQFARGKCIDLSQPPVDVSEESYK